MRICISVGAKTVDKLMIKAEKALEHTDLVELRLDWLNPLFELRKVLELIKQLEKKGEIIVTVRRKDEGGKNSYSDKDRSKILIKAADAGASYIDIEIFFSDNVRYLVSRARSGGASVILSYHDFSSTPHLEKLKKIVIYAEDLGADIAKIITYAQEPKDNLRCLQLVSQSNLPVISFCMGRLGILSRVLCPFMGSPFTYASLPNEPLAPGQLSVEKVKKLWNLLGLK